MAGINKKPKTKHEKYLLSLKILTKDIYKKQKKEDRRKANDD